MIKIVAPIEFPRTLESFKPLACVYRDGEGLTELSFSMAWSKDFIEVWWSGKSYSMLGERILDGPRNAADHAKQNQGAIVVDPCDPACPIEVNLEAWLECMNGVASKYYKRNAPFKIREPKDEWAEDLVIG